MSWQNNEDIQLFQEYLRIPSVHPDPDYQPCVDFLQRQADSLGLPLTKHYPAKPNKPIVIITWTGTDPTLKSLILNSHMDVVPAFADSWTHPPFDAKIDEDGKIFARGAQDMKCIAIWYLLAIKYLRKSGIELKRTVHMVFVPDEEISSIDGMCAYINTPEFSVLNGGFVLDESAPLTGDAFSILYGERTPRSVGFECSGTTGHGSLLHKNTAGEKVQYIINKFMEFRANEIKKLETNPDLIYGDVTSVNLTVLSGGVQRNVVPPTFKVEFDVRLSPTVDVDEFERKIEKWCDEAGGNIVVDYSARPDKVEPTIIDETNPFWVAFKSALCDDLKYKIKPIIAPGNTDSNNYRKRGIPAIGFTPLNNMQCLFHAVDEYITVNQFWEGIEIYKVLITKLANV